MTRTASEDVAAGQDALARRDWAQARERFETALAREETAEAVEGLGTAAFWLDDQATIEVRERAYRLYRARGDTRGAARMALALAWDHLMFRGEEAVSQGWLELAAGLLGGHQRTAEYATLLMQQADFALCLQLDPCGAEPAARRAVALAHELGLADLEMMARAIGGLCLVTRGEVTEGMRELDAAIAAALAGEATDVGAAGYTCCYMLTACEKVRDLERAAQWCRQAEQFCERIGFGSLFQVCRAHYATVLLERGEWDAAESTLGDAVAALEGARPALACEPVARVAELRRRQGRLDEAEALLVGLEELPEARIVSALLLLDRGDASGAAAAADRYVRQLPDGELAARALGLEVRATASAAVGEVAAAEDDAHTLSLIADRLGTLTLRGTARLTAASVHLAANRLGEAGKAAEDAVDALSRAGAPYGVATAHALLARVHVVAGRTADAAREAEAAAQGFDLLGAPTRAAAVRRAARPTERLPLTPRELDVLRAVALGRSNAAIAEELVLSEHTVHRHVANILTKLGVPSRAAAVAAAASRGLLP